MFFTLSGDVVLSCAFFGHTEKIDPPRDLKAILDVVHLDAALKAIITAIKEEREED